MSQDKTQQALLELAQDAGILIAYENAWKEKVVATEPVILCLLNRLGIPIKKIEQAPDFLKKSLQREVLRIVPPL